MKRIVIILLVICAISAAYYFLYPPLLYHRAAEQRLHAISSVVATKDRAQIADALREILAEHAKVRLEVRFFSIRHMDGGTPVVQEFTRDSFIQFIDTILYTLTDYGYLPELQSITRTSDAMTADMQLDSREWADGVSFYSGSGITMRFSTNSACKVQAEFSSGFGWAKLQHITKAECDIMLRSVPKAGQEGKFRDPEVMKQLLMQ